MTVLEVFGRIREHLGTMTDRMRCFSTYEFQAEGWLKAECMALLDGLKKSGAIGGVEREVSALHRKKIDLVVHCRDGRHWVELKHWLIGPQKGQTFNPKSYVTALEDEFEKFEAVKAGDRAWILALCTARPDDSAWTSALKDFNSENAPWFLDSLEERSSYSPEWFLGVLHAQGLEAQSGKGELLTPLPHAT